MDFDRPPQEALDRIWHWHCGEQNRVYTGGYFNAASRGWKNEHRLAVMGNELNWAEKEWMTGFLDALGDIYDLDVSDLRTPNK